MAEPLIFVTTATINNGEFETVTALSVALIALAEARAGLVAYQFHVSEDRNSLSNVQIHADAESMDAYLQAAHEQIANAVELTTISSIEVFGTPGPVLQQALQHNAEQGVPVRVLPIYLNGITRSPAA